MTVAISVFAAAALTVASVASFDQTPASPPPNAPGAPHGPPASERPIKYGPGWNATKCASARAEGQTVTKHDCPDIPAAPVPPKG